MRTVYLRKNRCQKVMWQTVFNQNRAKGLSPDRERVKLNQFETKPAFRSVRLLPKFAKRLLGLPNRFRSLNELVEVALV